MSKSNPNNSQTKNYSTLFSTAGKAWASALERLPRKYEWFSSGRKRQAGFAIIEVVLVLAIAGLIFLMVFIALPALQRSQRDTQRKNDMTRLKTAIESYRANNRGSVPTGAGRLRDVLVDNYLKIGDEGFRDPDGSEYFVGYQTIDYAYNLSRKIGTQEHSNIAFVRSTKCGDGALEALSGANNRFSIRIKLENGGVYCIDG
ncbi:MAG: type II secretion system protein [Candidatus Sacchiramonaceae bacterium]|nr:type II secretion system protein [Candidatus Saccharimonadaceae bacterium]